MHQRRLPNFFRSGDFRAKNEKAMRMIWLVLLLLLPLCSSTRSLVTKKDVPISPAPSGISPSSFPSYTTSNVPSLVPSKNPPTCSAPSTTPGDRPSLCSLQVGDACDGDNRCGLGHSCNNNVCSERVALGEACDSDYDCADPNTCVDLVCVVGPVQQGGSCDSNRDCGTFKDGTTCISSVCTEESGVGGPCEGDHTDCRNNLLCGESNLCLAAEEGDVCIEDSDCLGNLKCSPGYFYSSCQGINCFSGVSTVDVRGQGIIQMKDLKVNDWVRVSGDAYAHVHSFGHFQPDKKAQYLQIHVAVLDAYNKHHPLEITEDHLLFAHNLRTKKTTAVPAGSLKVGDFIMTQKGEASRVTSILEVSRRGTYAPLTATGDILVGGILASNYVSRTWLYDFLSGQTMHWLQHGTTFPHRVYCQVIGGCQDETYNANTGFSQWVKFWYNVEQWQLGLHPSLQILFLIFLALPAIIAVMVGMLVSIPIPTFFAAIVTSHLFTCMVCYVVWEKFYHKKTAVCCLRRQ